MSVSKELRQLAALGKTLRREQKEILREMKLGNDITYRLMSVTLIISEIRTKQCRLAYEILPAERLESKRKQFTKPTLVHSKEV